MNNIVSVKYETTGRSTGIDENGMREMQSQAFSARASKYILLKSPPASGKSRALMFIGIDKLTSQNLKKLIVAVPERSIASSFQNTDLKSHGFHTDWKLDVDLCAPGVSQKTEAFKSFMVSNCHHILLCTHSTLRSAWKRMDTSDFNQCLIAIDEFHHVSQEEDNRLGQILRTLIKDSNAHILAMTGTYFRGDAVPVLMPREEAKFKKITYSYYDQMNGYDYLKSLGIGYHFYHGKYTDSISAVLDTNKKTILHIPHVNSGESTKDKQNEVDLILDTIGSVIDIDSNSKIISIKRSDGKVIKVADLVNDEVEHRNKTVTYLRGINSKEDIDLIIALGMAKEGFDWEYCEHALTVGYRGSLTEIIQIIGRCTRDSVNKTHAQFTNLIAEPDGDRDEIKKSVNDMLKAITASLLMEQVLAPKFKLKSSGVSTGEEIVINGILQTGSSSVSRVLNDLTELKVKILQHPEIQNALPGNVDPEVINTILIPKVIREAYPDLSENEIKEVSQHVVTDSVLKNSNFETRGNKRFLNISDRFINVTDLNIDLINSINPFLNCFEVLSKALTPNALRAVLHCIKSFKIQMTDDEAILLWPKINTFVKATGRNPSLDALDPTEVRMAEAIVYLKEAKRAKNDS